MIQQLQVLATGAHSKVVIPQIILFFIFGLSIGSFLNVLIYRLPKNESLFGRSYCDHCKKKLSWYDLIPLLSFVLLKGKCRYCKETIDPIIPVVELTTALLFVSVFLKFPILSDPKLWFNLFFVSTLIVTFFTDLKYEIIPNKIIYPAILSSLFFIALTNNTVNHILSGIGAFLFFLILSLVTRGKGMGGGDTKLALFLGLVLGFPTIVFSLYLAFLTGGFISLILILWKKKKFKGNTIPFGPFLAFWGIVSIFLGNHLVSLLLSFL